MLDVSDDGEHNNVGFVQISKMFVMQVALFSGTALFIRVYWADYQQAPSDNLIGHQGLLLLGASFTDLEKHRSIVYLWSVVTGEFV